MGKQKLSEHEILKLGKLLIKELSLEERSDTLSRWICHYLAEKLNAYEILGTSKEKEALGKEIFGLVIQLWDRNKIFQHSTDPLLDLQNAIRNLNSLKSPEGQKQFFDHPLFEYREEGTGADEFIMKLKKSYLDVANCVIIASLLPENLKKSTKWKDDFDSLLSDEERRAIDILNYHLDEYRSEQIVFFEEDKKVHLKDDIVFLDYVLTTIKKRLEGVVIEFQSVKNYFSD